MKIKHIDATVAYRETKSTEGDDIGVHKHRCPSIRWSRAPNNQAAKRPPQRHDLSSKAPAEIEAMLVAKHPLGKRPTAWPSIHQAKHGNNKASVAKAEWQWQSIHQDNPNDTTVRRPIIAKTLGEETCGMARHHARSVAHVEHGWHI